MFFIVSMFLCLGSIGTGGGSSSVSRSKVQSKRNEGGRYLSYIGERESWSLSSIGCRSLLIPSRDCTGNLFLARWSLILALVDEIEFAIIKIEIEVVIGSRGGSGVGLSRV